MGTVTVARRKRAEHRELGDAIYRARTRLRWSQAELGRRAGDLSDSFISHVESGNSRPSIDVLRELARVLDVDFTELSMLGGYMSRRPELLGADAQEVRRFEDHPTWLKRWLNKLADSMLEDVPLRQQDDESAPDTSNRPNKSERP